MGRISSRFGSRAKHHRPLRPLLESLERRELLASFATLEDKSLVVSDPTLANIVIVSNPAHGTVARTDGGFVYKPVENYNGTDSFVYGTGGTASNTTVGETVTASITITPVNDAPSGTNKVVTLLEDTSYTFQAGDFGFTDPKDSISNNFLALRISTLPESGKLFNSDLPVTSGQIVSVGDIVNNRFRFVPSANALPPTNTNPTSSARFTFQVQDDGGTANGGVDLDQSPNTITLNVTPVNDAPAGTDQTRNVPQNASYILQLADFGFTDPHDIPSNSLRAVTIVTLPAKGQLQDNGVPVVAGQSIPVSEFVGSNTAGTVPGSRVKYVPDASNDGLGTFSFTFSVQDNGGTANGGVDLDPEPNKFTINVTPIVQSPMLTANPNSYVVEQNGTLTIAAPGVLGNDTKAGDGIVAGSWMAKLKDGASHGAVTVNADGSFTYKPAADYTGLDTFTYYDTATYVPPSTNGAVSDPILIVSNTAKVTLLVRSPAPFVYAQNDTFLATPNTPLSIAAPGVLKNDVVYASEVSNSTPAPAAVLNVPLQATLVTDVSHGTLTLAADGSFSYVPAKDFSGTDTFTYRASVATTAAGTPAANPDSRGLATVTIFVFAPQANNDAYSTPQNTQLTVAAPGVLANDKPADGHTISALLVTSTLNGSLSLNADGSFTYKPASGFVGTDSFIYRAVDSTTTAADDPLDTSNLTASQVLELINHGYKGFAFVTIHVQPAATAVVANNDTFLVAINGSLDVAAPGVLKNDYVILGDPTTGSGTTNTSPLPNYPLLAVLVSQPAHGTLELHGDGSFHYVPNANFADTDTFTYQAVLNPSATADPSAAPHALATVTINVKPFAASPVAFNDSYSTIQNTPLRINAPGVLSNDTKEPGATLSAVIGSRPSHGDIEFHSDGSFLYTPASGYTGTDTFTYQDLELLGSSAPPSGDPNQYISNFATVTINVKAPEPPPGPVAVNDFYFTAENTALGIGLPGILANDYVRGGDPTTGPNSLPTNTLPPIKLPLTAVLVAGPANGLLSLNPDGSFKYQPNKDFVGTDTFTYQDILSTTVPTLNGSTAADFAPVTSNIATVTIRVVPAVAHNDNYTTDRDKPLEIIKPGVLANDSGGSEAHPLMATLLSGPLHGTLKLQTDGSFRYEPAAGYVGADTFSYRASDGQPVIDPSTGVLATTATNGDANRPINAYDIGVVKIYVRPTITVPAIQAHDDKFPALKNTTLTIDSPGVLANDYGPVNVLVVAAVADKPLHGTLTLNEKGGFTYVPEADFVGEDKFTYTANVVGATPGTTNSTIQGGLATVTIYVMAPDAPPTVIIGRNQTTTDESGPQKVTDFAAIVAVGNNGQPPAIAVTTDKPNLFKTPPQIDAAGQLVYTPAPNASGTATITVNVVTGNVGDPATGDPSPAETFTIQIDKPHALYNAALPCDVTDDDTIAADDVLAVINYINAQGDREAAALSSATLPAGGGKRLYYDVDKDDVIAAIDVLLIINHINAQASQPAASALSGEVDASLLALVAQDAADATTGKRKT